jgi:hypothetical protein
MKLTFVILLILINSANSQQKELLEKAYKHNSEIILDEFFINWQNEIRPVKSEDLKIQNDTIQSIYKIYNTVFNAVADTRLLTRYLILSDRIEYDFVDIFYKKFWKTDSVAKKFLLEVDPDAIDSYDTIPEIWSDYQTEEKLSRDSILNFHPYIDGRNNSVFINKYYENLLFQYMFNTGYMARDQFEKSKRPIEESCKRINFFKKYIPTRCFMDDEGRVGYFAGFSIMTKPKIFNISFGNNYHTAQVYYSMDGCGFIAYMIKRNNEWLFLTAKAFICS